MATKVKEEFLYKLKQKCGSILKLGKSQSLYEIAGSSIRVYIRYSKVHNQYRMFYGLRKEDLLQLEGYPSIICFLWEGQPEPLLIPYSDYEDVFQSISPSSDGQFKVQIFLEGDGTEFYISRIGRFNVEGNFGWYELEKIIDSSKFDKVPDFTHSQIQTLLGAIGNFKGFDVWIPTSDRNKLDWEIVRHFECCNTLPYGFSEVEDILREVDVVWIQRGSSGIQALFEVEHSTPIYSGLLRFNDIYLVAPSLKSRFSIVSNNVRRSLFVRQLHRPTFRKSGLNEMCTFLEYVNVYAWFNHLKIF